jgi:hypothetical protein
LLLPSRSRNIHQCKDKTQASPRPSRLSRHNSHPNTQDLNENVAAGHVINNPSVQLSFPEDDSKASQLARINAAIVTLQNLNGEGSGCPVASTTFLAQEAAINDAGAQAALSARQTAPSPSLTPAQVDALAPQLGFTAGKNPSGKGANIAFLLT